MSNSWDSTVGTKEYNETLVRAENIAAKSGLSLNEDSERVQKVIGLMTMNLQSAGNYFCPCKQSHPLDASKDVLCPCPEISDEINADGCCFCKLFFEN